YGWTVACSILLLSQTAPADDSAAKKDTRREWSDAVQKAIGDQMDRLEALYTHLHTHPELSLQEEQTAARLARELREIGFEMTEKVGGHGVVGMLKNGKGPTVLVRTDLDALPVVERTGLPYASKVRARDRNGNEVGVMH